MQLPDAVADTMGPPAFGVGGFVFREEPEADGDLVAVEELAGEGDHAVHEVGLDEGAADLAFAGRRVSWGMVGGHALRQESAAAELPQERSDRDALELHRSPPCWIRGGRTPVSRWPGGVVPAVRGRVKVAAAADVRACWQEFRGARIAAAVARKTASA